MSSSSPYYRKPVPEPKVERDFVGDGSVVDLAGATFPEAFVDRMMWARRLLGVRHAAAIRSEAATEGVGNAGPPTIWPNVAWTEFDVTSGGGTDIFGVKQPESTLAIFLPQHPAPWFVPKNLLELKWYPDGKAPTVYHPTVKCLALLEYLDYFPDNVRVGVGLRSMVSRAILSAQPGWCGSSGPGVDGLPSLGSSEGNYDMSQMRLLPMAYRHYHDLSPAARDHLITQLLARGDIHRPNRPETYTSGRNPDDWDRAGVVSPGGVKVSIGETENHILMIQTARYLTNQLLYQRANLVEYDKKNLVQYDNRRNGTGEVQSCFVVLMTLLRNIIRGDFSEYNAKPYQEETRWALLNLCSYAYDYEVRLGARMVLDYISAHLAVSTNDLRRMVPFRRRFEGENIAQTPKGFMNVSLLSPLFPGGADPMGPYYAIQAGNIRSYYNARIPGAAADLVIEVASDYRIPESIQDLFVNDLHRRFFQRLQRTPRNDEMGGGRNSTVMEIYASSPSYLITAGGSPSMWAVDPSLAAELKPDDQVQQLGAAVTTSFMPTGLGHPLAAELIQFGEFSSVVSNDSGVFTTRVPFWVENYGVAPDFACGHQIYLPYWVNDQVSEGIPDGMRQDPHIASGWTFVNLRGNPVELTPGFYLAIYQETPGGFALMEAFDTWLNQGVVTFQQFKDGVLQKNRGVHLAENVVTQYTTWSGNEIEFVIWTALERDAASTGASIIRDSLGSGTPTASTLLSGDILNSPEVGKTEIGNPFLGTSITLDFTDLYHPRRVDTYTGEDEVAGFNNEVWVDLEYAGPGPSEGDVYRPYKTIGSAVGAVADGGKILIVPGGNSEREVIGGGKRFTLVAPIGGVTIGGPAKALLDEPIGALSSSDLWVQFDLSDTNLHKIGLPLEDVFNSLSGAISAVADGGIINVQPGATSERLVFGKGKRFTLVAPIGGLTIGRSIGSIIGAVIG